MSEIIFARTRHVYESYVDFWRLVELAGFSTCYTDEIDAESDNLYIFTPVNGENKHGWENPKARIILWQLEWGIPEHDPPPGVAETWSSDAWNARITNARYVVMGSNAALAAGVVEDHPPSYDAAFLAYLTFRREWLRDRLRESGVRLSPSSLWGDARHTALLHSRAYLNIHQRDDAPTVAPLRMVIAAAYRLPVITEAVEDQGAFYGKMITEPYNAILKRLPDWLQSGNLHEYGAALHSFLCEDWTFRRSVEASV